MTYSVTCPHCRTVLKSKAAIPSGQKIKCLKCENTFRSDVQEEPSASAPPRSAVPKGAGPVIPPLDDDLLVEEDLPTAVAAGSPPAKARKDDERKRPSRPDEDDEEDYLPRTRKRRDEDDRDPPRPKRARVDEDEDEDDYRPRSRRRREEDEGEDDRPRSRRSRDDDDDDRPRRKKKKESSGNTVLYAVLGSILGVFLLCGGIAGLLVWRVRTAVHDFGKLIDEAKKGQPGMIGEVINDAQAQSIQVTLDKDGRYHNANQLTQADARAKDRHFKVYKLDMQAGRAYSIEMTSNSVDSFLRLVDANGNVLASDDDSGGNFNSRILYQCPANGTYRIHATYLTNNNQPAPWNYDVVVAMLPEGAQVPQGRGGRFRNRPIQGGPPLGKLTKVNLQPMASQSFAGVLNQGDARFGNMPHHVYEVALQKGKNYRIDMTSQQFDTFLFILDAANQIVREDDDGGDDLNARIIFAPPADGNYKILASSFDGTGSYTLTITPQ